MKTKQLLLIILSFLAIEAAFSKSIPPRKILKMLRSSEILNDHFTGFSLYDLSKRKMISGLNDDKYFTPASNTKLFTFYASLKLLKDSIAGLQYVERGDSLIFWGTADPSFLDPQFKEQRVLQKLNATGKKIYRAKGMFTGDFYGVGWTYDELGDQDRLFNLLPQGGKTGTLKNLFKADKPYVFAKTGSLSNNHNLSGYLITASGKKLIFSFMNNNFTRPTAEIRSEMEKLITQIYKNY
ncbi:MAG: D-alanyl-D-alanine carboxypeptidase [Daejeonella sp.]|nr:D-alanyl-D-alanine carboxypeptidase [Daejeonella sp.]